MKHLLYLLLLVLTTWFLACSPNMRQAPPDQPQLMGSIVNPAAQFIQIGDQRVYIQEDGSFIFTEGVEKPAFLELEYAGMEWTIFLKPDSRLEVIIPENRPESVKYTAPHAAGLVAANAYLLEVLSVYEQVTAYLNENWYQLHKQEQQAYVAKIDSLKEVYFNHHAADAERLKSFPAEFSSLWRAELDFSFNTLILRYPERHLQFTGNQVSLSKSTLEYLKSSEIDNSAYTALPSYKSYTTAVINSRAEAIVKADVSERHYSLKKMEAILQLIPELFANQYLRDFWTADYLTAHIGQNGIANSEMYISQFRAACKTEGICQEVEQYIQRVTDERNDHEVKVYKTKRGFKLEAHIFKPKDFDEGEKHPAIAIFHGGGWQSGSASWAFDPAKNYAEQGMLGIAVQYRLSNYRDVTPIEAMEDARDLFLWLRTNAAELHIDPDKIAAEGWSAGGHLVVSAALFADTITETGIHSAPNALILKSPALDTNEDSYFKTLLTGRALNPKSFSPVDNVSAGLPVPPTLILQGRTDRLTPTRFAQLFNDRMLAANYTCELVIYENCGHIFTPSHLDDTGFPQPDPEISKQAEIRAYAFLKEQGFMAE